MLANLVVTMAWFKDEATNWESTINPKIRLSTFVSFFFWFHIAWFEIKDSLLASVKQLLTRIFFSSLIYILPLLSLFPITSSVILSSFFSRMTFSVSLFANFSAFEILLVLIILLSLTTSFSFSSVEITFNKIISINS